MDSISVENLTKNYNGFTAVDNLTFNVKEGEIFGLLGPNGAGKTTTIRMLATLISPTEGQAFIGGYNIQDDSLKIREIIGILTESPSLYNRLTALENMEFFAKAYGVTDKATRESKICELLKFFQLWDRRNDRVGQYSKGMKQKLAIARGLIHEPSILFLDEPTSGLDPKAAKDIRDLMEELSQKEKQTILLCTHRLEDAEKLCDNIMIIKSGKSLTITSPKELRLRFNSGHQVKIGLTDPIEKLGNTLRTLDIVQSVVFCLEEKEISISLRKEDDTPELVKFLVNAGIGIEYVNLVEISLEEAYLELLEET